jgi:L-iditol 2-dehydrogenase
MGTNCAVNYAIGYQFPGGFQEYMLLNQTVLRYGPVTPIPDDIPYPHAAIAEPLGCGINGLDLAGMAPGKSMGIIGLGPIGCMMLELAEVYGASRVFAVQRSRKRLEMARSFSARARFICSEEEDPVQTVMKETDGEGLDFVITTAGTTQAQEWGIQMVRHRGTVNLFAGLKNQPPLTLDSNIIHYREAFVMGSHGSLPKHHKMAVDLISQSRINAANYISREFPLEEIADALGYHESRQGLKVVIRPHGS